MRSGRPVLPRSIARASRRLFRLPRPRSSTGAIRLQSRNLHGLRWHSLPVAPWDDDMGLGTERWL